MKPSRRTNHPAHEPVHEFRVYPYHGTRSSPGRKRLYWRVLVYATVRGVRMMWGRRGSDVVAFVRSTRSGKADADGRLGMIVLPVSRTRTLVIAHEATHAALRTEAHRKTGKTHGPTPAGARGCIDEESLCGFTGRIAAGIVKGFYDSGIYTWQKSRDEARIEQRLKYQRARRPSR